jgi:hypothetical protein
VKYVGVCADRPAAAGAGVPGLLQSTIDHAATMERNTLQVALVPVSDALWDCLQRGNG